MYSNNDFRFYSEKHLAHGWGHTAEQKEAEREYNKWYYQNHKERWAHVNDDIKKVAQDNKLTKDEVKELTKSTAGAVRDEVRDYTKKSINNLKRAGNSLLKTEAQKEADKKAAAERGKQVISSVLSFLGKGNNATKSKLSSSKSKKASSNKSGMTVAENRKYHLDAAKRVEEAFPGSPNTVYHLTKATGGRRSRKKFYGNGGGNANKR